MGHTLGMLRTTIAALLLVLAAAFATPAAALPPVKHVFIVVLENKDYEQSFGPDSKAPYLAKQLTADGQLLENYFGTSHLSLGNYISMVSGIAPNPDTQGDCNAKFIDVFPGTLTPDGQVIGSGCVYPPAAKTVVDQLDAAKRTWRGYMEDMGNSPPAPRTCRHPAVGDTDDTQKAREGDQYATRHNPFMYFHSIIDDQARCDAHVVPLDQLTLDLRSASTTPDYVFVTPDLCSDGHDEPCVDGRPGGLPSIDVFLKEWVPKITRSRAYKDGGMIFVTWDEANFPGSPEACCGEPTGPNTPSPGINGPGGGRTGSIVISPFTRGGTVNRTEFNHYSLLRSVEDIFGLTHLGYANLASLKPFGADVFNEPGPGSSKLSGCKRGRKVIAGLRLARHGSQALLELRSARAGRLLVRNGRRRLKAPSSVRTCREYRVAIPSGHHTIKVQTTSGRRTERRKLRY
jgi:hypothetical protein